MKIEDCRIGMIVGPGKCVPAKFEPLWRGEIVGLMRSPDLVTDSGIVTVALRLSGVCSVVQIYVQPDEIIEWSKRLAGGD